MEELKEEVKTKKEKALEEMSPDDKIGQYIRFPVGLYKSLYMKSRELGISLTAYVVLTLQNKLVDEESLTPQGHH